MRDNSAILHEQPKPKRSEIIELNSSQTCIHRFLKTIGLMFWTSTPIITRYTFGHFIVRCVSSRFLFEHFRINYISFESQHLCVFVLIWKKNKNYGISDTCCAFVDWYTPSTKQDTQIKMNINMSK